MSQVASRHWFSSSPQSLAISAMASSCSWLSIHSPVKHAETSSRSRSASMCGFQKKMRVVVKRIGDQAQNEDGSMSTARNAMPDESEPLLSEETQHYAKYIAIVVRNAMEDYHVKHLSDEQMKELNPIIRNAIATALHAFNHYEQSPAARRF